MFKAVLWSLPGIALTVLCWGVYGPVLHKGQALLADPGSQNDALASRLKPLICVGVAYFVIAIMIPVVLLALQGRLSGGWSFDGISWSLTAGAAGALGALGIILALTAGGKPVYVMPIVFGCAPIINVAMSMYFAKIPWSDLSFPFLLGLILVSVGAVTVLVNQPSKGGHAVKPPAPIAADQQTTPSEAEK